MSFTQRHARVNISSMVRFLSLSFKLYGPVYSYRNFFCRAAMEHKLVLKIQETEKEKDRLVEDKMSVLEVNIV